MSAAKALTTLVSSKGQVILPKAVRERRGWDQGVRLEVLDTEEGVLLREQKGAPLFPPTRMEDVFGMAGYIGPPVSVEDMNRAVRNAAVERHKRSLPPGEAD